MDITLVIKAIIALLSAVITAFVVPWLRAKRSNEELAELLDWVRIGVQAAEQIYGHIDGPRKKEYVLQYLASIGYTVDDEAIDNAIEAAVLEIHAELYGSVTP